MFDYVLNTRMSLVLNEVWVDEEPISLMLMKNQQKIELLNGTDVVNVKQRTKNIQCLCCHEVEAVQHFELLDMRNDDVNSVTQRV